MKKLKAKFVVEMEFGSDFQEEVFLRSFIASVSAIREVMSSAHKKNNLNYFPTE